MKTGSQISFVSKGIESSHQFNVGIQIKVSLQVTVQSILCGGWDAGLEIRRF